MHALVLKLVVAKSIYRLSKIAFKSQKSLRPVDNSKFIYSTKNGNEILTYKHIIRKILQTTFEIRQSKLD